jgi:protein-disulfide isomerase
MQMLGGVLVAAIVIVVLAVVLSSSGSGGGKAVKPGTKASNADVTAVTSLLSGIPQSGTTLGSPKAPITITEYADLECPVCDGFALPATKDNSDGEASTGYFDQLVSKYVRTGKAKIVYRSLETATGNGPNSSWWVPQQAAAYAAGLQGKAWDYIELFYYEQQPETDAYVNTAYLEGIAKQIPGLDYASWSANRLSPTLEGQVTSDGQAATARGFNSTPTIVITGPKGQAQPIVGLAQSFSSYSSAINSVS